MDVIKEITEIADKLNEVEDYCSQLINKLSSEDLKMQDLLHYIEKNKISPFESWRLVKKIKQIRLDRRKIKNDMELSATFYNNKNKLISTENRKFLLIELHKKDKQLKTEYKNRYYQECEIENILKGR